MVLCKASLYGYPYCAEQENVAKCLVWKTRPADPPGIYSLPTTNSILVILFFFGFKLGCVRSMTCHLMPQSVTLSATDRLTYRKMQTGFEFKNGTLIFCMLFPKAFWDPP